MSPHLLRVVTLPGECIQQGPSDQEHTEQIKDALDLKSLYLAENQNEHWGWQEPQQCKLPHSYSFGLSPQHNNK